MKVTREQRPALNLAQVKSCLQLTIPEVLVAKQRHIHLLTSPLWGKQVGGRASELGSFLEKKVKAKDTEQKGQQLPGPLNVPPSCSRALADSVVFTPC